MKLSRIVVVVLFSILTGCKAQLHHGLDEAEANTLQNVLREHGIDAQKLQEKGKRPTWSIEVDDQDAPEAQRILAELELPRPRLEGLAALAESGSVVPTPTEEHLRKVKAYSDEIALTLQAVDGVTSARVLLALPPPPRPGQPAAIPKASAFLRVKPGALQRLEPMRSELAGLVAGSIEGLTPSNVTVVLQEAVRVSRPVPTSTPLSRLRIVLAVLAVTVSVLALGIVLLTLRLRQLRREVARPSAVPAQVPAPKPSVAPAATRRVA